MTGHLFWILPPLVGALIGYVTNLVAIKMLFRPLRELRLFGLRLPFTPGILPRERAKLAESIGDMVERELLTAGVLRERLAKPEVREHIGAAIGSYSSRQLARPVSSLLEDQSSTPLAEVLSDFFNSEVFNFFLEEIIKAWAAANLKFPMRGVVAMLTPALRDMLKDGLARESKSHAGGEMSAYRQALENSLEKYPGITLKEFLSLAETRKRTIDSFLAEKTVDTLEENIEAALSSVNVKALVTDRINSLDMIRVEKIIMDVMAGQLKWINFFGGLLGALIGFFQVILWIFLR